MRSAVAAANRDYPDQYLAPRIRCGEGKEAPDEIFTAS
jgi:hypothetical protein